MKLVAFVAAVIAVAWVELVGAILFVALYELAVWCVTP